MVQLPSVWVTTVWLRPPLPVVVETLDDTLPPPEFMVTELPPLVCAVTLPPPAVTELDSVPSLDWVEASRSTILQFLSLWADAGSANKSAAAGSSAREIKRAEFMFNAFDERNSGCASPASDRMSWSQMPVSREVRRQLLLLIVVLLHLLAGNLATLPWRWVVGTTRGHSGSARRAG